MRVKMLAAMCWAALCVGSGMAVAAQPGEAKSAASLDQVMALSPGVVSDGGDSFAFSAIRDMGLAYGMRGGLAWESERINKKVEASSERLDRIFNFQPLMMPNSVVPPVLVQANDTFNQEASDHVTLADVVYRIEKPARLSSMAPTWREYLIRADDFNPSDVGGWAPRNEDEQKAWTRAVEEGWELGVTQAQEIFEANLSRLSRDLKGMILYRSLYARNMVTEPVVSRSDLGVTGGDDEMNVNETVLVIREKTRLQKNPEEWLTSTGIRHR